VPGTYETSLNAEALISDSESATGTGLASETTSLLVVIADGKEKENCVSPCFQREGLLYIGLHTQITVFLVERHDRARSE
jgi:hypothetical protein